MEKRYKVTWSPSELALCNGGGSRQSNQRHQTCTFILQGKNFHFPPQDHNLNMSLNDQWCF